MEYEGWPIFYCWSSHHPICVSHAPPFPSFPSDWTEFFFSLSFLHFFSFLPPSTPLVINKDSSSAKWDGKRGYNYREQTQNILMTWWGTHFWYANNTCSCSAILPKGKYGLSKLVEQIWRGHIIKIVSPPHFNIR